MGFQMQICSISHFSWSILLKCCMSANKLQQNSNASSREDYIPQILTVLLEIHRIYIWPLPPFVCHLWTIAKTIELLCWPISASDRILDRCDVFSMEFLSLSCRRSSSQNFPNGQERGETAAFPSHQMHVRDFKGIFFNKIALKLKLVLLKNHLGCAWK